MTAKSPRTYIKIALFATFAVVLLGYILFEARNVIQGPVVTIESPEQGTPLSDPFIEVRGHTKNIAFISFNDRQTFVDEKGRFSEQLLLSYGYNIITIKAEDRFGRTTKETLEIVYR